MAKTSHYGKEQNPMPFRPLNGPFWSSKCFNTIWFQTSWPPNWPSCFRKPDPGDPWDRRKLLAGGFKPLETYESIRVIGEYWGSDVSFLFSNIQYVFFFHISISMRNKITSMVEHAPHLTKPAWCEWNHWTQVDQTWSNHLPRVFPPWKSALDGNKCPRLAPLGATSKVQTYHIILGYAGNA